MGMVGVSCINDVQTTQKVQILSPEILPSPGGIGMNGDGVRRGVGRKFLGSHAFP